MPYRTIIEPFRIHSVQAIALPTEDEREAALVRAGYNLFGLHADEVIIDLLTDSGTGSMSDRQWAGMLVGDESYAGSRSFYRLQDVVCGLIGMPELIPTHQGRAAERILFSEKVSAGDVVPNNTHFDTTRANIEYQGATALDLVIPEGRDPAVEHPFKGNLDVDRLVAQLHQPLSRLALVSVLGLLPRSLVGVAVGAGLRSAQDWAGMSSPAAWTWLIKAIVVLFFGWIALKAYRATRESATS